MKSMRALLTGFGPSSWEKEKDKSLVKRLIFISKRTFTP